MWYPCGSMTSTACCMKRDSSTLFLLLSPFTLNCYCRCFIYLVCIWAADMVHCKSVYCTSGTSWIQFIVQKNRLLPPSSRIMVLIAFPLYREAELVFLEAFQSMCRAAESTFLQVQKKWSSFLPSPGSQPAAAPPAKSFWNGVHQARATEKNSVQSKLSESTSRCCFTHCWSQPEDKVLVLKSQSCKRRVQYEPHVERNSLYRPTSAFFR